MSRRLRAVEALPENSSEALLGLEEPASSSGPEEMEDSEAPDGTQE